ncbi:MAG: DUF3603 family protein, partial [Rickettsiales bacterium]|nr:DUF3603 family protein [Rickettsiales bacterium]
MQSAKQQRIYGLDLARSLAIFLAIIGHSVNNYNGGKELFSEWSALLFRSTGPTFITVFGIFVELVYAPVLVRQGPAAMAKKLFVRAVQCYTLYAFSCLVLALVQNYSVMYTLRMVVLLGATPYTDILKFYAAMLLLSPLFVMVKHRYGIWPLVAFCLMVHVLHYFFYPVPYYDGFTGSDILFTYLYGASTVVAGPSVLHGITFVVTGMWLGSYLRKNMSRIQLDYCFIASDGRRIL